MDGSLYANSLSTQVKERILPSMDSSLHSVGDETIDGKKFAWFPLKHAKHFVGVLYFFLGNMIQSILLDESGPFNLLTLILKLGKVI